MSNGTKAIKTEYRGIVFDSKSEAVFARTLDIAGLHWIHHPGEHCGHPWDFLIARKDYEWDFTQLDGFIDVGTAEGVSVSIKPDPYCVRYEKPVLTLVEFKPSPPTDTYIENLKEKMRCNPIESILVWGSPWAGILAGECSYVSYPIFTKHGRFGWGDFCQIADNGYEVPYSYRHEISDMLGITEAMAQQAKEFRFDLRNQLPKVDTARKFRL